MDDLRDWLALHRVCWTSPQAALELIVRAGGVSEVLRGRRKNLCQISDRDWSDIEQVRAKLDWRQADHDLAVIKKKNIEVIFRSDPVYPPLLRTIADPPFLLFLRGGMPPYPESVSIVGSRKATPYGREVIERIVPELVAGGLSIVSGLAFGIDAAAHRSCLCNGGTTIAVLASGVDDITPATHQKLGELIMQNGALCSEVPVGMPAHRSHFLWRNRIISGLSRATLIVEAEVTSGSLVTAGHAADQGREVFTVPGPITSALSGGCNGLLRDGASPCIDAGDILCRYVSPSSRSNGGGDKKDRQPKPIDASTARFLETVSARPCTVNQLGDRLQLPIAQVLQLVTALECAGMVAVLPGGYIARK